MTKPIATADIELRKSTDRGGFTIWIAGEQWGIAAPQWCGGNGLMHNLRYPNGGAIQDAQENGYRYAAKVRGFKMRQLDRDSVKPTPPQEDAIKGRMVDLINRGLVDSPTVIADRRRIQNDINEQQRATRQRHEDWMREGLLSLGRRSDLTDKESFAIKTAYKECFCAEFPEQVTT